MTSTTIAITLVLSRLAGINRSEEGNGYVKTQEATAAAEYLDSDDLETLTGTKASTWRYWAMIGEGPASFKLGRRRVWKRSTVQEWLARQETA
ncbi:MAG: helix-turn-helix transcriptional regulator [Pseudolabrys sp.]